VVVIDPGHGGHDQGGIGPAGLSEKTSALKLARALDTFLEDSYRVVFTRNDDYHLSADERISIANKFEADLFISVHHSASPSHSNDGIDIFVFSPVFKTFIQEDPWTPEGLNNHSGNPIAWNRQNLVHSQLSMRFAAHLNKQFGMSNLIGDCSTHTAPLAVLSGVDSPAVFIDLGHISHPPTESLMRDPDRLKGLASQLAKAVFAFFSEKNKVD
jgi:N-acetylmuramoyl-L-alanine amidase